MKIILTDEVDKLGSPGDIVEVAGGYARNFLVPRGLAITWSKGAERQIETIQRARASREIRSLDHAKEVAAQLQPLQVKLNVRAGKGGKLFGSVTQNDVAAAVRAAGGPVLDRKRIELPGHIKAVGSYEFTVNLHPDVAQNVALEVVAQD